MKNNKKIIIVLSLIMLAIIIICSIIFTYATFSSEFSGDMQINNATWQILVNNTDISLKNVKNFTIDKVNVGESQGVEADKLAPGLKGDFNILVDPTDTDVAIKYELKLNTEYIDNTKIKIKSVIESNNGNTLISTGTNTYVGIMSLDNIKKGLKDNIKVNIEWKDEGLQYVEDGEVSNSKIKIPVELKVSQYLGETIQ